MLKLNKQGITLLEIVISLSLVSIVLIGILQIFNVGINSISKVNDEILATNLARGLMSEIMGKAFIDPEAPGDANLGPNPTGSPNETRFGATRFDDVDDYNGFTESPPRTIGNVPMDGTNNTPNCRDFTWSVAVACVDASMNPVACPTDYKRVTITVDAPRIPNLVLVEVKADIQ